MDDLDRVLEEVERLDREATPGPWVVEMDGDGDEFHTWEWPWRIKGVVNFTEEGENEADPPFIALSRTAAPRFAAEVRRLRDEVEQRIAYGNALYDAIVRRLAPHFPTGSRDLEWDVLPGTLAALARERDGARDRLNELTAPVADFDLAWLRQNGDPCCHCGVPLSKHAYEAHGFVESVPVEELLAREVVRLRTTRDKLQAALARRDALDAAWNAGAAEARGRVTHDPSADPRGHMPPEFRADEEIAAAWLAGWVADAAIVRLAEVEQERDEALRTLAAERGKRRAADAVLARLAGWCLTYGDSLRPCAGAVDTYGDGVRAMKEQVASILRATI